MDGMNMALGDELPFDSRPAWETWIDIIGQYDDPNCSCQLCVAFRAWVGQSVERTETEILDLRTAIAKLGAGEDKQREKLEFSLSQASVKLRRLLKSPV